MKIIRFLILDLVHCLNILIVDDLPSPSHQLWNYNIANELLKKGHNVTLIGPRTIDIIEHNNYTMLELTDVLKTSNEHNILDPEKEQKLDTIKNIDFYYDYLTYTCQDILKSPDLKLLINYPENFHFDLLIFDLTAAGCLFPLIQRFKYPPTIGLLPLLLAPYTSEIFGNSVNPSYQPFISSKFTDEMTFIERFFNHFYFNYESFMRLYIYLPIWNAKIKEYFGENSDEINNLEQHFSILLCNIMLGFHYPRAITPNIIPVGGLHIKPVKKLPKDLLLEIENSKNGVILFSLGTNIRTDNLDLNKITIILNALGKLNVTVICKIESTIKNIPSNVIIKKWLPQSDILAHPKTKAFISHCGALGTMESMYHGVPIIGLPFYFDQHHIGAQIEKQKIGKILDYKTMSEDQFFDTIQEVLYNPIYSENIRKISAVTRDQTETPLERAIFWIEWTIRHNGSHILDPKSRSLPLYINKSLDIYLFLLTIIIFILLVLKKIISYLTNNISINNKSKNKIKFS